MKYTVLYAEAHRSTPDALEHLYLDEWVRDMHNRRLVSLHYGDMTDSSSLIRIIGEVKPDEIYNPQPKAT